MGDFGDKRNRRQTHIHVKGVIFRDMVRNDKRRVKFLTVVKVFLDVHHHLEDCSSDITSEDIDEGFVRKLDPLIKMNEQSI